jgi:hypothetical protein
MYSPILPPPPREPTSINAGRLLHLVSVATVDLWARVYGEPTDGATHRKYDMTTIRVATHDTTEELSRTTSAMGSLT